MQGREEILKVEEDVYKFLLVVVAFVCVDGLRDSRCFFIINLYWPEDRKSVV